MSTLRFEARYGELGGDLPVVDGRSLIDLVAAFEEERGWDVAGSYGPAQLDLAPEPGSRGTAVVLLGCECGEIGCWPLEARVRRVGGRVVWDRFRQPHRPGRDYTGFGPFTFPADVYAAAVTDARHRG